MSYPGTRKPTPRKPKAVSPRMAAARAEQGRVFDEAWKMVKARGGVQRPTGPEIAQARMNLGLKPRGTSTH